MADINFGVNILPKTNSAYNLGSSTQKWNLYVNQINGNSIENIGGGAPVIINSKSGNPIMINDGIPEQKLYDMKVSFFPKQEGTGDPSPTNIRPITGWTGMNIYQSGKNLLDVTNYSSLNGIAASAISNGVIDEPSIGSGSSDYVKFAQEYLPGTYTLSCQHSGSGITGARLLCDKALDGFSYNSYYNSYYKDLQDDKITFTSENSFKIGIVLLTASGHVGETGKIYDIQFEMGDEATEYEIYSAPLVMPISWQSEAGTVYGGKLDVSSGELIITHIMVSDIWGNIPKSDPVTETGLTSGYLDFPENVEQCVNQSKYGDSTFCNMCATIIWGNATFIPMHYYINTQNRVWMAFPTDLDSNTPIQIVGKLVTPRVVNVDPVQISLLTGTNAIWTDANSMEIEYPVDTKKYVDAGSSNVKDVQLNGTSIISSGIANIPFASSSTPGVVKTNYSNGITINNNGELVLRRATGNTIKTANDAYAVVTAYFQHESVFYGLAAAAGDVTQSSSNNTIGTYTTEAKSAIQTMLGVISLPSVTSADEGKVLRVANGEWSAISLPSVSGVSW